MVKINQIDFEEEMDLTVFDMNEYYGDEILFTVALSDDELRCLREDGCNDGQLKCLFGDRGNIDYYYGTNKLIEYVDLKTVRCNLIFSKVGEMKKIGNDYSELLESSDRILCKYDKFEENIVNDMQQFELYFNNTCILSRNEDVFTAHKSILKSSAIQKEMSNYNYEMYSYRGSMDSPEIKKLFDLIKSKSIDFGIITFIDNSKEIISVNLHNRSIICNEVIANKICERYKEAYNSYVFHVDDSIGSCLSFFHYTELKVGRCELDPLEIIESVDEIFEIITDGLKKSKNQE